MKPLYYNLYTQYLCVWDYSIKGNCETGTQERGTDVMWFHTRNCTEITQEVSHNQR